LLLRTFAKLISVDPGFDQHNVFTGQVALGGELYDTTAEANAFYRSAGRPVRSIPGVGVCGCDVTDAARLAVQHACFFADTPDQLESVQFRMITPDYFKVMRIHVCTGREFADTDSPATVSSPQSLMKRLYVATLKEGSIRAAFQYRTWSW
jgi:hypothetical protein